MSSNSFIFFALPCVNLSVCLAICLPSLTVFYLSVYLLSFWESICLYVYTPVYSPWIHMAIFRMCAQRSRLSLLFPRYQYRLLHTIWRSIDLHWKIFAWKLVSKNFLSYLESVIIYHGVDWRNPEMKDCIVRHLNSSGDGVCILKFFKRYIEQ